APAPAAPAPAAPPKTESERHRDPNRLLAGRYRLLRPLGAGGMSEVYLAKHARIGKQVAIKILADKHRDKPVLRERFVREARATAQIEHPNIIEISDFGETEEGAPFFVMEYLEGENLGRMLAREGPQPWPRVAHFAVQIARGLEAAPAAGLIHRDLKPDNCVRVDRNDDPDFIKVIDFGIAKATDVTTERLTKSGIVVGTPEYVAPEQAQGQDVDHRADV
ncbi:MAG: serine/threonine protein kinase, partial [Myxococcales bacterium]|nr:serine/threonine protein kinase [Myxococcales bacterium]